MTIVRSNVCFAFRSLSVGDSPVLGYGGSLPTASRIRVMALCENSRLVGCDKVSMDCEEEASLAGTMMTADQ